jgi:hypothetical protein
VRVANAAVSRHGLSALAYLGVAALVGVGALAFAVWQSVTVEVAKPNKALARFAEIRERFAGIEPLFQVDAAGNVTRREVGSASDAVDAHQLHVLAYRAPEQRLAQAEVPFWMLTLKGPAVQYALRDTGFDLARLGLTAADLKRYGVCLLLDETRMMGIAYLSGLNSERVEDAERRLVARPAESCSDGT